MVCPLFFEIFLKNFNFLYFVQLLNHFGLFFVKVVFFQYFFHIIKLYLRIIFGGIAMIILKVSKNSNPGSVAGALSGIVRERGSAELQAIGAAAVNQAVKAVAIARGFLAPSGFDIVCTPAFSEIEVAGEERTAIKFLISDKNS